MSSIEEKDIDREMCIDLMGKFINDNNIDVNTLEELSTDTLFKLTNMINEGFKKSDILSIMKGEK